MRYNKLSVGPAMKNIELSKEISYALRHASWEYELEMDEAGWVLVGQFF